MNILVEANPTVSTAIMLDEAGKTVERITAVTAVDRVLDGSETRIHLDDELHTALQGLSVALHDGVHDTSGGSRGNHVFADQHGMLEEALRLFAALPAHEVAKLSEPDAFKRHQAAEMIAGLRHIFVETPAPVDAPIELDLERPMLTEEYEKIDWKSRYDWVYDKSASRESRLPAYVALDDTAAYQWSQNTPITAVPSFEDELSMPVAVPVQHAA